MNALGRVLKSWENNDFSLPALIQRKGKEEDVGEQAAPPVKGCPWESARFQLRPGGVRNIM